MPQILVVASDAPAAGDNDNLTLRERVIPADFESGHFGSQLIERIAWAVEDAAEVERSRPGPERRRNEAHERPQVPQHA